MASFIETPIVEIFVQFYGILGLHVYPTNIFSSFLRLLWNVLLNILLIYRFLYCDPLFLEETALEYQDKPLLYLLCHFDGTASFLLTTSLTILYFAVYSQPILILLDAPPFRRLNISKRTRNWALIASITFTSTLYSIGYYGLLRYTLIDEPFTLSLYLNHLAMYLNLSYQTLPLFAVHYIQYCTYVNIEIISTQFGRLPAKIIIQQISTLAQLTSKLHRLLSLPLIGYFFVNLIDWLVCFSYVGLDREYRFTLYVGIMVLYIAYLIHLNRKTQLCLQKMSQFYGTQNDSWQLTEIERIYGPYCQWSLFSIINIDNSFFTNLAIILANYTVLIWQTKK